MVSLRSLTLAAALLACALALAVPASAATAADATCTGVLVGGKFTGSCPNDPACPSPDGTAAGIYVLGKRQACI